ncbi:MAG: hypothetical protein ACK5UW_05550 [bacterium]
MATTPNGSDELTRLQAVQARVRTLARNHGWFADAVRAAFDRFLALRERHDREESAMEDRKRRLARELLAKGWLFDPKARDNRPFLYEWVKGLCPVALAERLGKHGLGDVMPRKLEREGAAAALAALDRDVIFQARDLPEKKREAMRAEYLAAEAAKTHVSFQWRIVVSRPADWQEPADPRSLDRADLERFAEADYRTIALHRLGGLADVGALRPIVPEPKNTGDRVHPAGAHSVWRYRFPIDKEHWYQNQPPLSVQALPPGVAEQLLADVEVWAKHEAATRGESLTGSGPGVSPDLLAPLAEPSGMLLIPLSAHAHARLRVDEGMGKTLYSESMENLQDLTRDLVAENPWIKGPIQAATAWAFENYAKSEELRRENTQRVLELCRALLASGRIRDPNRSDTSTGWLRQEINWSIPNEIVQLIGDRSAFSSFTPDEERRIAPALLTALDSRAAWERLNRDEQRAESERFLASPEAKTVKDLQWEVYLAKPEEWADASFCLNLDPDALRDKTMHDRVGTWLVALGGLHDRDEPEPIVPRPTGELVDKLMADIFWDGRCLRLCDDEVSIYGGFFDGVTTKRMNQLVRMLKGWLRDGIVPGGWGRRSGDPVPVGGMFAGGSSQAGTGIQANGGILAGAINEPPAPGVIHNTPIITHREGAERAAAIVARDFGTGDNSDAKPPDLPAVVALTKDHDSILAVLGKTPTKCKTVIDLASTGPIRNRETVERLLRELAGFGLVDRPHGKRKGYALTDAGRKRLPGATPT